GVDSIVGIQLVSRARQAGLRLDPVLLFRHPSIAGLAEAIGASAARTEQCEPSAHSVRAFELAPAGINLERLHRTFADQGGIEDLYSLTPVQAGMLFHTLADPDAGHYVEQLVCRVRGELDQSVLRKSWDRVVARHAALRSTIHIAESGPPYQVVHCRASHPMEFEDWRALSLSEQDKRFLAFLDADRRRGFDTGRPPLSRLTLIQLEENLHQLIWSIHHVVIDGWCLSVLLHEVLDIALQLRAGREPALSEGRPFREYVAW